MIRTSLVLALMTTVIAVGPVAAQAVLYPGQPFIGDLQADRLRDRMESQRQASAEQAAFARQTATGARLRLLEIEAGRQPEPYIRRETPLRSLEEERLAREQATTRRETVTRGVGQIEDWLARAPR